MTQYNKKEFIKHTNSRGKEHRIGMMAVQYPFDFRVWTFNDKDHRLNGFAYINDDNDLEYPHANISSGLYYLYNRRIMLNITNLVI